jgi:hypothetical protein
MREAPLTEAMDISSMESLSSPESVNSYTLQDTIPVISQFDIVDTFLNKLNHNPQKPADKVVNILKIIGAYQSIYSEYLRNTYGSLPIPMGDIAYFISKRFHPRTFRFVKLDSYTDFTRAITANLSPDRCAVAATYNTEEDGFQVFMIYRNSVAPHPSIFWDFPNKCVLTDRECRQQLEHRNAYFLLSDA